PARRLPQAGPRRGTHRDAPAPGRAGAVPRPPRGRPERRVGWGVLAHDLAVVPGPSARASPRASTGLGAPSGTRGWPPGAARSRRLAGGWLGREGAGAGVRRVLESVGDGLLQGHGLARGPGGGRRRLAERRVRLLHPSLELRLIERPAPAAEGPAQ